MQEIGFGDMVNFVSTTFLNSCLKLLAMKLPKIHEIRERSKIEPKGHVHVLDERRGYTKFLDYLANYVVLAALFLRLSPTGLTWVWVVVQFLSTFFFLAGNYWYSIVGIILFQCMFILDLSDGKLYRFLHPVRPAQKKLFPKYLDRLGHYINNPLLFITLGIGTSLHFGPLFLYLGLAVAVFYLLNKAITLNPVWFKTQEEREKVHQALQSTAPRSNPSWIKQFLFDFLRIEHLGNLLFVGIILDRPQYVLGAYAIVIAFEFLRKSYAQMKVLNTIDTGRA